MRLTSCVRDNRDMESDSGDGRDSDLAGAATIPVEPSFDTLPETQGHAPSTSAASDRYRLEASIGKGGMGEVMSAHDYQLGRSVAIKRMVAANAAPDAVARFVREAEVQARLDHPAIPPVYELWHDERGRPLFAMKRLSGVTLADLIASTDEATRRKFSRNALLRAFVDVCLAIEFAHTRGVIHRDLKPANIMLGEFGDVYVLDWGVARVLTDGSQDIRPSESPAPAAADPKTVAGSLLGTPGYMAPEQISASRDLDGRADVYALGCILFEILVGSPLHRHGVGIESALAGTDARPSVRAPDRDIAPELDAICVRATMVDRDERFATAREVGDAVQRYLDGDRDLALRTRLAADALALARSHVAEASSAAQRQPAIRAAGRALALDPSSTEAAELVAQLMLEPPADTPPEVSHELEALDDVTMRSQSRLGGFASIAYVAFLPLMYAAGFRDAWFFGGITALVALILYLAFVSRMRMLWIGYVTFVANSLVIAIVARATSPFLIAPGLALLSVMLYSVHPRIGRAWFLWATSAAVVMLPWVAELVGLLSPTTLVKENTLVLHLAAQSLDSTIIRIGLAVYVLFVLALATVMPRALATQRLAMARALQLQSWQLRQLVPH